MRTIPLTRGKVANVIDEHFEELSQFKWHARKCKKTFYAQRHKPGDHKTLIHMHHEVLRLSGVEVPPDREVDHRDRNGLNNVPCNLRVVSHRQNILNRRARGKSKYLGVAACRDKWRVTIGVDWKKVHVGYFTDEIEAARAYDAAAMKYHGEFANLNFPGAV